MAKKRVVLEIGLGTHIRGEDPTKAACRALRDALWHNSLSIATALGQPLDAMIVDVHIGVARKAFLATDGTTGSLAALESACILHVNLHRI